MKIAIEAQRLFRKKKHGMDIVALELIKHLQQLDQVNEYFILVKPDTDNKILSETPNFHIIEIQGGPYPLWEQYHLPKMIRKINPDILHCTSNTTPIFVSAPLVLTLHDILFMQRIDFTKGTLYQRYGNLYRRLIVPRIIHKCKKIITVSGFQKKEIDAYFSLPPDRVKVIYNSFDYRFKNIAHGDQLSLSRKKFNLPEKFILYLGNTHPNKNINNVLKAISLLHHETNEKISLVMPDIDESFLSKILAEIDDPGLRSQIILTGYIPNSELKYVYTMASVFLYPSFYESFGIPILEAMACGTPVITSNAAAMPEIAAGAAIIIDPKEPTSLKNAMITLLSSPIQHSLYRERGLQRAKSFDWRVTADQVMATYLEVYMQAKSVNREKQSA